MNLRARPFIPTALAAVLGCIAFTSAQADEVQVAVAANFTAPIQAIARDFHFHPQDGKAMDKHGEVSAFLTTTQGFHQKFSDPGVSIARRPAPQHFGLLRGASQLGRIHPLWDP